MTATLEEVIHFNCTWCGMSLTVPARMAGISGPCPKCGNNITSPQATSGNAQPTQAFSSVGVMPPPQVSAPSPLPQPPVSSLPSSLASGAHHGNGNGAQAAPLGPNLNQGHLPGTLGSGGPLPQPGSSNKGSSYPALRPLTGTTVGQGVENARPQTRAGGSHDKGKRRGALYGALFMILLASAGTGFFFKDQVVLFWKQAQMKWKSHDGSDPVPTNPALTTTEATQQPAHPQTGTLPTDHGNPNSAFNPNTPTVKPPETVVTQPVPPAKNVTQEPSVKPKLPENVLSPTPPLTNPTLNAGVPTETPTKVDLNTDSQLIKKALPAEYPRITSPMVEVPGHRNQNTGKVDVTQVEDKIFVNATPDAQPAALVLKQFFTAKTWQDRLSFTQAPEVIRPLMERYYGANSDGPLPITRVELIRHDRAPEMGSPHCVFQVSGPGMEQPLPVMVESSAEGWKVDWLTFTEFKDKLLLRFLQSWSAEPGRFHVMMRRTHYFDEDVPNLDKKYCFELTPPEPGMSGFVFVPKGNLLARELDKSLGWEITNVAAVVELQWRKQDRLQWVEMTAVPQYNWRGPVAKKTGAAAVESPDAVKPMPVEKAMPVEDAPPQSDLPRISKK